MPNPDSAPDSALSEEQVRAIKLRQAFDEFMETKEIKQLDGEPMQLSGASDVNHNMFSHRNAFAVLEKETGLKLHNLPAGIAGKLPDKSRFTVYKSRTNRHIVYLEAKPKNLGPSKWFEIAPRPASVGSPSATSGTGAGAQPSKLRTADLTAVLDTILKGRNIPIPDPGQEAAFWQAIEKASTTPASRHHPDEGTPLHSFCRQVAAAMLGTKPGVTPERINRFSDQLELDLSAEAHRQTREGYKSWSQINAEVTDAVQKISATGTTISSPQFLAAAEALTGRQWVNNTTLEIYGLGMNTAALNKRIEMIAAAQVSIDCAVWKVYGDEVGAKFTQALVNKRAAAPTIPICLVVDGNVAERDPKSEALLNQLRSAGVEVMEFHDDQHPEDGMHWKALMVDVRSPTPAVIIGGRNIGGEYLEDGRWRDTDILCKGQGALAVYNEFAKLWNFQSAARGTPPKAAELSPEDIHNAAIDSSLRSDTMVMAVTDLPGPDDPEGVAKILTVAIDGAQRQINIEQGYFLDVPAIMSALASAAGRGVKIRVFTNGDESIDVAGLSILIKAALSKVASIPNVETYTKKSAKDPATGVPLNTLHSKFMTVDGEFGAVGSWNQHGRSMILEAEGMIFFNDKSTVASLDSDFEKDINTDATPQNADTLLLSPEELEIVGLMETIGVAQL
jgi:cardiolipin synthase